MKNKTSSQSMYVNYLTEKVEKINKESKNDPL